MREGLNYVPISLELTKARAKLGYWLGEAAHFDAWIPVKKHGKIIGGLIGPRDLTALDMASKDGTTWNEYTRWERRVRIELLNETLKAQASQRLKDRLAIEHHAANKLDEVDLF